jgi:hypothetical protein
VKNKLSNGNFKEVMERNLPVSVNVEPLLAAKLANLPPGIANQLQPLQVYNAAYTTATQLNRQIAALVTQKGQLLNSAYNLLLENDSLNIVLDTLENENSQNAYMALAATYVANSNFVQAQAKLNELSITDSDIQDWIDLNSLLINLNTAGKSIYEMNSQQLAFLQALANKMPGDLATSNAQAILFLVTGEEFPTYIPGASGQNQRTVHDENNSLSLQEGNSDEPWLGANYPNPFNHATMIPFKVPVDSKSVINIYSCEGKLLSSYPLSGEMSMLELQTSGWAQGIYFYSLVVDGTVVQYRKMSLIK